MVESHILVRIWGLLQSLTAYAYPQHPQQWPGGARCFQTYRWWYMSGSRWSRVWNPIYNSSQSRPFFTTCLMTSTRLWIWNRHGTTSRGNPGSRVGIPPVPGRSSCPWWQRHGEPRRRVSGSGYHRLRRKGKMLSAAGLERRKTGNGLRAGGASESTNCRFVGSNPDSSCVILVTVLCLGFLIYKMKTIIEHAS